MQSVDLEVSDQIDLANTEQQIEDLCLIDGLRITMKDTLRQYPGATHWHFKRGKQSGTLELTLWPDKQRIWFDVHKNRNAPWIEETLPRLKSALEQTLTK